MDDLFEPVRAVSASEQVANALRRIIVEGRFRPGETLPPERTLAARFSVTRNTVREALRRLDQMRLVSIRQGRGITVRNYLASAGLEFIADLLKAGGEGQGALMGDIAEARAVIGLAMGRHAIGRMGPDSLVGVRAAVEAFAKEASSSAPDIRRLQELDFDVHNALLRGGGNQAILLLHNSLRHIYRQVAALFEPVVSDPRETEVCHREMVAALERGDGAGACAALERYFELGCEQLGAGRPGEVEP